MESIITEIVDICKSENNLIRRERALMTYFFRLIRGLFSLALMQMDNEMVSEMKEQGYQIDKKTAKTIVTMVGEVRYCRRKYVKAGSLPRYPLDERMGFDRFKHYSPLTVRNVLKVSAVATYRNTALAVDCLSGFSISHMQVGNLIKQAGKQIKEKQEADSRYDGLQNKKKVPVLYLEGDGVVIKGTKKRLEFHRYQVCEDIINLSKTRRKRVNAREFVSLNRLDALNEIKEYLAHTYDLSETLIISNADGGAGYTKKDFDEIVGCCGRHEHFLDVFHLNKKIKDRLCFVPQLQGKLIRAVEFQYSREKVKAVLDTAESLMVGELDTPVNRENLKRLRSYLSRRWADIKPFRQRHLTVTKAIGCCESNHRQYTYRVKGQGKYWSEMGAEGMLRVLTCIKNQDLDYWLSSEFSSSEINALTEKELQAAARDSLKKRHETHLGIQHGALTVEVAGNGYLNNFARALSHINI